MYKSILYLTFLFIHGLVIGQEHETEESTTLMRRDYTVGLNFNANGGATGWGVGFDYGFQKNYKYKNTVGFTLTNIRHEKEYKIYGSSLNSSKGYYYGKLKSVVAFRPTYGGKLMLFPSKRESGIEISAKWSIGPSIALIKPVYLKIDKIINVVDEAYDPEVHHFGNITARSSWYRGLSEATLRIGAFGKFGFDFNFSSERGNISGGEVGVMVDYIVGETITILHDNPNDNLFMSLYLQFNIGQRLY